MYSYESLTVAIDRLGDLLGEYREIRRQVENGGFGEQMLRVKLQEIQKVVANCSPLQQKLGERARVESIQDAVEEIDAYVREASQSLQENLIRSLQQRGISHVEERMNGEMERVHTGQEKLDVLRKYAAMLD